MTAKKPRPKHGIGPEQIAAARDPVRADPPPAARKSAIVTARSPKSGRFGPVQDFDAEEHRRRGDAAEALFRESCAGRRGMPGKPERYWRSYGTDPLPTAAEAMAEPFAAFPSWMLRITCDRCGKDRMFAETHFERRDMQLREIIKRMRHDGCGGRAGRVELATGIEGVTSRPVRKIVLLEG